MDLQDALIRSHRNNLQRYRRLLATQLTELERDYIRRRIAEEREALQRLLAPAGTAGTARGKDAMDFLGARRPPDRAGEIHA